MSQRAASNSVVTSKRFIEASVAAMATAVAACVYPKHKETSRAEMAAALALSYLTLECYPLNAKEPGRVHTTNNRLFAYCLFPHYCRPSIYTNHLVISEVSVVIDFSNYFY